jgi:hypothetical protein
VEINKEFEFYDYKFTIGVLDKNNYTVGLLSWPGLRSFGADELRKYRYVMLQAQREIDKMQLDIERVLTDSLLGRS